jgi:multidrug efflux pump subunit AcrA (membrane-fusion protein)
LTDKEVDARRLIVSQREQASSQRRNNILIAEAQRTQQEANAERLEWKIREAQRRLEQTALIAPFDGIISDETVETGRSVNANEVVASIYDDTGARREIHPHQRAIWPHGHRCRPARGTSGRTGLECRRNRIQMARSHRQDRRARNRRTGWGGSVCPDRRGRQPGAVAPWRLCVPDRARPHLAADIPPARDRRAQFRPCLRGGRRQA